MRVMFDPFGHLQDSSFRLRICDDGYRRPSLLSSYIHLPRYQVSSLHVSPHSFTSVRAGIVGGDNRRRSETQRNNMISAVIIVVPIYAKSNRRLSDKFRCNGCRGCERQDSTTIQATPTWWWCYEHSFPQSKVQYTMWMWRMFDACWHVFLLSCSIIWHWQCHWRKHNNTLRFGCLRRNIVRLRIGQLFVFHIIFKMIHKIYMWQLLNFWQMGKM